MRNLIMCVLLCALLSPLCFAQQNYTVTKGPWTLIGNATKLAEIHYKDQLIANEGILGIYLPNWSGDRMSMDGCTIEVTEDTITWYKSEAGNQTVTMTVKITDSGVIFALDTLLEDAGPVEFSLNFITDAMKVDEDRLLVKINKTLNEISLKGHFDNIPGINNISFEQVNHTFIVDCNWFDIQDRRTQNQNLFMVKSFNNSSGQPITQHAEIQIKAIPYSPEQAAVRATTLSQHFRKEEPLEVKNSGFEDEPTQANWDKTPQSETVTDNPRSGSNCLQISIPPGSDLYNVNPYVTQQVPIVGGRLFQAKAWIRTQDIVSAQIRDMHSTGATIILEYADKQGQWLAGGGYARSLFYSQGWQELSTPESRAPDDAGFAIIFLALRGTGTAWFDDVTLNQINRRPVLSEPIPAASVHDNTPTFRWTCTWKAPTKLQVSQDPAFPSETVISLESPENEFAVLQNPIAPGKWYWRIIVPDLNAISDVWEFTQTAALEEDTTEPVITDASRWIGDAKQPLLVPCTDNGTINQVVASANGNPVNAKLNSTTSQVEILPEAGWAQGLNRVKIQVSDAVENSSERIIYVTHSLPQRTTVWREHGGVERYLANVAPIPGKGTMEFLLGMYGARIEDMPRISQGGFDFVHNYTWDGDGTNESAIEYLDAAQQNGMQAFIGFSRQNLMNGNLDFVAERIGALMTHPGLICWYLFDEPELVFQYVSPQWLERYYRLIKALDPFHPVVVTCAMDDSIQRYKNCFDVHWTQVYSTDVKYNADRLDRHRADLIPSTPLSAILHCYDTKQGRIVDPDKPVDLAAFQPDAATMRASAFVVIAHDSSNIEYWWWGQGSTDFLTIANAPQAWENFKGIIADIKILQPVLTAPGITERWVEKHGDAEIHLWVKFMADKTTIIAVNVTPVETDAMFEARGLANNATLSRVFEDGTVQVKDGKIPDHFTPKGVHVYEIMK